MQVFKYPSKTNQSILALGPESNGNFSVFNNNTIHFSEDFGDLLLDANYCKFKNELSKFIKENAIKPDIILTDLHPLYKTTVLGKNLAKRYKAEHIQIQHHLAHIFSAVGEKITQDTKYKIPHTFIGIALDGTGYGTDGKIWGGEVFRLQTTNYKLQTDRIGHLENQVMIGGDLAIQEPARMLTGILDKISRYKIQDTKKSQISNLKSQKYFIYSFVKKYYSTQEFEVLYAQLQQNFNCIETSSCGRVLDAVSILLGFCTNKRNYKHEPIELLEKNSTKPYTNLKPVLLKNSSKLVTSYELLVTPLFEYLIRNLHKDKKRLAATAQLYIAEGLYEIIKLQTTNYKLQTFLAGGISNNKIISKYFESKKNKTGIPSGTPAVHIPRGDAGLSFGQIIYFLLNQ
ncbi:MAG: putative carbamoyltransferase HypF [Candidatus Moranbacteria bacterium GW2011_GWA2_39_41]|nr:MAG: putative carbamoyltransferase HypF [Candidatus Moranbacteria bacterium GW2011_GWA2_39_41]